MRACAGLAGACALLLACPVSGADLEAVVVTARKSAERRDEIPLAVDVIDASRLAESGAWNMQGVAAQLPGLGFESQFGASGGIPTLRGLLQPSLAADNVGVFVDGVYQASRAAIDVDLLDIERIELQRGPQSALYGHSTFAGALQYISRAPTTQPEYSMQIEGGSDRLGGARVTWSGPLAHDGWLMRLALGLRAAGGTAWTRTNDVELGAYERSAASFALASPAGMTWNAMLRARLSSATTSHPAVSALLPGQYNCGSRDSATGLWSYYCGEAPRTDTFGLSATPDSHSDVQQAQLHVDFPFAAGTMESDSSVYAGTARIFRDFDASAEGQPMGVCRQGVNCPLAGQSPTLPVRILNVQQVLAQRPRTTEWTQELRWHWHGGSWNVLIGAAASRSFDRSHQAIGAGRGDLAAGEQLTALLPVAALLSGAVSQFNRALVADPATTQVDQTLALTWRRSLALFGALEFDWGRRWRLRMEARQNHERVHLDSRLANFVQSFGDATPQHFDDFTPRASIMYRPGNRWSTYVSLARGARSGGINAVPNLDPTEQAFEPESNWTAEWGARYAGPSWLRRVEGTVYYVDWRHTQTLGYAATPGVTNLITTNLAGIISRGVELQAQIQPASRLRLEGAYSFVDSRYRRGTDDPGSIAFCGLGTTTNTSTFCTIGAPRNATVNARRLVPWIDNNSTSRSPRHSAFVSALVELPGSMAGGRASLGLQASYQGDMYERGIEGLYFGERTLANARLAWQRRAWTVALWSTNLLDRNYIRSSFSRQPQFFPTQPRPLDMIYGEGRRIGMTLEWRSTN